MAEPHKVVGLIGGTGLDQWGDPEQQLQPETPFGDPSGPLSVFRMGHNRLLFLPRHGSEHKIPPHRINYRANLWALKSAGASQVLSVNAVGGITEEFQPGTLALPDQLIDYTWGRAHTFSNSAEHWLQHVDFTQPFDTGLRDSLLAAGNRAGLELRKHACVAATQGPRLETAAEIRRLRNDGCDLVGMTSMPETALARELGLPFASIAVVANVAAGIGAGIISMKEMELTLQAAMQQVRALVSAFMQA